MEFNIQRQGRKWSRAEIEQKYHERAMKDEASYVCDSCGEEIRSLFAIASSEKCG